MNKLKSPVTAQRSGHGNLLIFSPLYTVDIGDHVFPTRKFQLVADLLKQEGAPEGRSRLNSARTSFARQIEPTTPAKEDLLLAHTPDWVNGVLDGKLTLAQETAMEMPWSPALARAHALAVSGTILACRHALADGAGLHIGGGSHHAFADHGEGFCVFNDLACGILKMRAEGRLSKAAVVDLDVHQGNGTSAIFRNDPRVMTFSMHQRDIYPGIKVPGTIDIELEAGTRDEEYLKSLEAALPPALDRHKPELVVYQAGVDCYERDLLGGLRLSVEGLGRRDEFVVRSCRERDIPVAVTLGGGYAENLEETVRLHAQTLRIAAGILSESGSQGRNHAGASV